MKKFIKKTTFFLLSSIIGVLVFVILVHAIVRYNSDFSLNKEYKYLILGHSHPRFAFNDNLISDFKNLANSGESYFYNYYKLREVLLDNKPKAIFIEYSNNNIKKIMDEWIWGDVHMSARFDIHSPFMDIDDLLYLYKKNSSDFVKVVSKSVRNNLSKILSLNFSISKKYGGYEDLNKQNIVDLINNNACNINTQQDTIEAVSIENIKYLRKLVQFSQLQGIKVYFIRSPQHNLLDRQNEDMLFKIKDQYFHDIEYLDFDQFPLKDDEYADFDHLNYKGAKIFSLWFNDLIRQGLLTQKDKNAFIKKKIHAMTI